MLFRSTSAADGTLTVDTNTYLTANHAIILSGDISGTGTTAITTTIGASKVTNTMLAGSIAASKLVGTDIATVGTITAGTWNGTAIGSQYGGTGLDTGTSTGVPSISSGTWSVNAQLPVSLGGTGQASYADGQLLIGNTLTGLLSKATLTAEIGRAHV